MAEVGAVVLTYNSIKFIGPCLDSLFSQGLMGLEVIVVDNGSQDRTAEFIRKNYPQVILLENKENLGAARARNQGIEICRSGWVLVLDCDIVLAPDFLMHLLHYTRKPEPALGMLQPKILNIDRKTIYSCGILLTFIRRFYDIGKGEIDNGRFDESKYIFGACSAAALYNRKMLEDLKEDSGYFDERFFFLIEDVDLSWRSQRDGYRTLFAPEAVCYHWGNSSATNPKLRQYLSLRNRYYAIRKNESLAGRSRFILSFFIYELPRFVFLLFTNPYLWKSAKKPC
jgi:GT2 family glycosyltransferase